jgi:hypothetical protein
MSFHVLLQTGLFEQAYAGNLCMQGACREISRWANGLRLHVAGDSYFWQTLYNIP